MRTETYKLDFNNKENILKFLEKDSIIEASAGTGKTYTIVELVKTLILEKNIKPDNILIVTFTEKATGELKDRIFKKFESLLKENLDTKIKETAQFCVNNINLFEIHTIHSFCNKIINQFPVETKTNFQNSIINDSNIIEEIFFDYIRKGIFDDFKSLFNKNDISNDNFVKDVFSILGFSDDNTENIIENDISGYIKKVKFIFILKNEIIDIKDIFNKYNNILTYNYDDKLLKNILLNIENEKIHHNTKKSIKNKIDNIINENNNNFKFNKIIELVEYYINNNDIYNFLNKNGLIEYYKNIIDFKNQIIDFILIRVYEKLKEFKKQNGLVSFDDMIHYVYNSVSEDNSFVNKLREIYKYAFIDEFQDTDPVQWYIFKKIFLESNENKICIIGDPKQSIYLFRNASVSIFFEAKDKILEKNGYISKLSINYRSTKELVESYNKIFINEKYFSLNEKKIIEYDQEISTPNNDIKKLSGIKSLNFIKLNDKKEFIKKIYLEIKKLITDKNIKIYDTNNINGRNICLKDIAILVSSRNDANIIQKYLSKNGISSSFYKKNLLFQSDESIQIFYLIDYFTDMKNSGKLKKILLSDFFILSNTEDNIEKGLHILSKVFNISKPENIISNFFKEIEIEKKIFLKYRDNYKRIITNYTHIAEKIEFIAFREKLNLYSMKERLLSLIYSEKEEEIDDDLFRNEGTEEDNVKIMTIHISKGLEFPIVFDFGAIKGISENKKNYYYSIYDDLKKETIHNIKYKFNIFDKEIIIIKNWEEYRRLHYVAITRAKYICYLPLIEIENDKNKNNKEKNYNLCLAEWFNDIDEIKSSGQIIENNNEIKSEENNNNENNIITENKLYNISDFTNKNLFEEIYYNKNRFFSIESFSSLNYLYKNKFIFPDNVTIQDDENYSYKEDEDYRLTDNRKDNLSSLIRGTKSGTMLHKILEKIDYSLDVEDDNYKQNDELIDEYIKFYLPETTDIEKINNIKIEIKNMLNILFNKILINDFKLKKLTKHNRKNELEFYFYINDDFINGEIDLLFNYNNTYYIIDWKSNTLDNNETIENNFKQHYDMQAKIYTYAIKKYLEQNISNFDYNNNFGGIFYIYLRYINENNNDGIFFKKYSSNDIKEFYYKLENILKQNKNEIIDKLKNDEK